MSRPLVLLLALVAGCATTTKTVQPDPIASSPAPSTAPSPTTCEHACERYRLCVPSRPQAVDDCKKTQCAELEKTGSAHATAFGKCLDGLTCDDLDASLKMDMGKVGACYAAATH